MPPSDREGKKVLPPAPTIIITITIKDYYEHYLYGYLFNCFMVWRVATAVDLNVQYRWWGLVAVRDEESGDGVSVEYHEAEAGAYAKAVKEACFTHAPN